MGTPNVQPKSVAWWPDDDSDWPVDSSTNTRLLRFRWNEPWNHGDNWESIKKVGAYVKAQGAVRLPEAAQAVREISEKDLEERVTQKFKDIVKALKDAKLFKKPTTGGLVSVPATGEDVVEVTVTTKPAFSKTQAQSWSSGVSSFPSIRLVAVR